MLPVLVAVPAPTLNTPGPLKLMDDMSMFPAEDPSAPLLVTAAKVKAPEVEVTVVPAPMVERPETVRARDPAERVPTPPAVTKVPATVASLVIKVAVPPVLRVSRLLKATPVTLKSTVPAMRTVPLCALKVPAATVK